MNVAYIALGTNIEPRVDYIEQALELLCRHERISVDDKSHIYETAPVGYLDQSDFLNLVIKVVTSLTAIDLLDVCQLIERKLGRERTIENGPRTIDLDILLYNDETIKTDRLTVPHPRMAERAFVLIPLEEIAPMLEIVESGKTVRKMRSKLPEQDQQDVVIWKNT